MILALVTQQAVSLTESAGHFSAYCGIDVVLPDEFAGRPQWNA